MSFVPYEQIAFQTTKSQATVADIFGRVTAARERTLFAARKCEKPFIGEVTKQGLDLFYLSESTRGKPIVRPSLWMGGLQLKGTFEAHAGVTEVHVMMRYPPLYLTVWCMGLLFMASIVVAGLLAPNPFGKRFGMGVGSIGLVLMYVLVMAPYRHNAKEVRKLIQDIVEPAHAAGE